MKEDKMELLKDHADWLMDFPCGDKQKEIAEAIWTAVDELKRQEKYRWHDLRKNPEDLPEEKGRYIVAYNPCHWSGVDTSRIEIDVDTFRGKSKWAHEKYLSVIAWREIEPFKMM